MGEVKLKAHESELLYTIDDDGVHLSCWCGWEVNLGHFATVQRAWSEWQCHLQAVALEPLAGQLSLEVP